MSGIDEQGQLTRIDYGDRVYFDSVLGWAGTTYPIGTADMPSSVIADTIAICAARHVNKINVTGTLTIGTGIAQDIVGHNIILTLQTAGVAYARDLSGYLEIDEMTGGTLNVYANSADIQINADCTAGTINIYGNARVVGVGGGVTINNYTINSKLAGQAPVEGSVTANWNTANGTSGELGEDLVTIGIATTRYKLHSLLLDVLALTDGAKIHVKLFMKINSNERKVYDQEFTIPTTAGAETPPPDTLGLWIVNGTVVIHDTLRVEVHSDTNENVAIGYTYVLEAMQ